MIESLQQIPNVVWAAVLGSSLASLITLGGVFLANRNSRAQQMEALKHDTNERDREREMALRREVYLPASEAISRALNILMRLPDLNIPIEEFSTEFYRDSATMAKIQVIGSNDTVQTVSVFSRAMSTAYLELILKRVPLMERKAKIESLTEFINMSYNEINRYIDFMQQLNLEGVVEERKWKVIDDHIKLVQKHQEKATAEREQLSTHQKEEIIKFTKLCIDKFTEISELVHPAVFAVREELEMALDEEAYLRAYYDNSKIAKQVLDSFLAKL